MLADFPVNIEKMDGIFHCVSRLIDVHVCCWTETACLNIDIFARWHPKLQYITMKLSYCLASLDLETISPE